MIKQIAKTAGLSLLLAVAGIVPALATTYYVSPTGSDSNNGTSTSTPWRTAAKVNAFAFASGDAILFQRGGEWHENLNPTCDGAAGNPITFADYGTGNKPKFWGSDPLNNAGFTLESGQSSTYVFNAPNPIGGMYVNHANLIPADAPGGSFPVESLANSFYWANGVLKINVPTNPATDGKLYTAATRQDIVANGNATNFFGHSHLVFTNFIVDESGITGGNGYGVRTMNGVDVTMNGIESYRCGKHSFGAIDSTQVIYNNCYGAYPMPYQSQWGGYTAFVSYGDNVNPNILSQTSEYHYCVGDHMQDTFNANSGFKDGGYEFFTTHGANVASVWLDHCEALSSDGGGDGAHWTLNNADSNQVGHPAAIKMTNCYMVSNQLYMSGVNLVVDGLHMTGPGATTNNQTVSTIDMEASNCTIQNTLMENLNVGTFLYSAAIQNAGSNNVIRFCTLVNNPNSGNPVLINNGGNLTWDGNIIIDSGNWIQNATPPTNLNNLIYATASSAGFNNAGNGDYSLSSGSPAIDEVPLSVAYPSTDYYGAARPHGGANDAGAYQFGSPSEHTPTFISSLSANGNVSSPFSYQIIATNNPRSFGAAGLPAGLSVNTTTGIISGTPTAAGTTNSTISAVNSAGTGSATLSITINAALGPKPVINSSLTASGAVGSAFSYQITATNSPSFFSASPLPSGLSVDTSTGLISGNPNVGGITNVNLTASNANGEGTAVLVLTITTPPGAFNVNAIYTSGTPFTTGGLDSFGDAYVSNELGTSTTFNGSTFTFGAANAVDGWSNLTVPLTASSAPLLNMVGTAAGGIPTAQTFTVTYTDSSTQNFTVNMSDWASGGALSGETKIINMPDYINNAGTVVAGHRYLAGWTLALNGKTVKSITLPANRGVVMLGFASSTGSTIPVITSALTKSGQVGAAFSYTITATNSPTSYGAAPLPAGLSVNTGTGIISGTPTATGSTNSTISATNSSGTGSATLVITISASGTPFNINAIFTTGTAVTNGGADSFGNAYQSNLLGASATFNGSSFTFGPANAVDAYSNLTVALPAGTYTTLNMLGTSTGGNVTNQTFTVHYTDGTTTTLTQSLHDWESNGSYPGESLVVTMADHLNVSGASVTPACYVHGYTFALNGKSVQSITLPATRQVIAFGFAAGTGGAPAPAITSALTKSGTVGTALTYNITATNSPTSYNATSLPAGLSVNTGTGAITGTPTTPGIYSVGISATNAGGTGSATLTMTINNTTTAFNINAIFTTGTAVTNGGADSFGSAYESDQLGTSATFDTKTFTFGPANSLDGWSNTTVNLPAGNYTTLDMVGSAVGGNVTGKVFTVNYTDGTNSTFTIGLHDWESTSLNAGEVKVVTMADHLNSAGASVTPGAFLHGYTFTLNGKSVLSITLPATRQVIALGFAGH